ncbi:hypothetical protein ACGFRB_12000 [Streptomyces sp. NPDC048718]|uniref:hypothetical protein n=1 Tax=Streptomyces sp. NPDC048718 TaxID=3365587 RepID=UPI003724B207
MAGITKITVQLITAPDTGAGTHGFVYIGVAGREFHVDSSRNDFEPGDNYTYVFGDGSNVLDAARNDPRHVPALDTDDVDRYPVYLRFEGVDNNDDWLLDRVIVTVNPGGSGSSTYDNPRLAGGGADQKIWLSQRSGKTVYLRRV